MLPLQPACPLLGDAKGGRGIPRLWSRLVRRRRSGAKRGHTYELQDALQRVEVGLPHSEEAGVQEIGTDKLVIPAAAGTAMGSGQCRDLPQQAAEVARTTGLCQHHCRPLHLDPTPGILHHPH